jgi:Inner membrane protein YgaP-like, transmembrane domain
MLTKNESALDRVVRTALGGGLLIVSATSLGVTSGKPLGIVVAAAGVILLFTAATGSCLLYRAVGIDTSK